MLVERQCDYIVVSQQFAGIEKTFHGLVVKPESTLVEVEVESTDVVESTHVVQSTDVKSRRVYGRCQVYGRCRVWRDVERVGGVRGLSGETLNPLERERFVWSHVEPAGMREVRLVFVWNLCVT